MAGPAPCPITIVRAAEPLCAAAAESTILRRLLIQAERAPAQPTQQRPGLALLTQRLNTAAGEHPTAAAVRLTAVAAVSMVAADTGNQ